MASESKLGEAFVPIRATLDKLDGDLKQARNKVEGAMKGMEDKSGKAGGALKVLGTQVDNLKKQVPGLGTALNLLTNPLALATIGIGAFAAAANKSITATVDYNKQVREMMQLTGLSAEETSRIIQVSDDWGISIETARSALEMMNKKGISPSIDNLAKIADEYINSSDKAAFAEEANTKYGRSFSNILPILAQGGDAFREQADAIDENMLATDESIAAARKFEVALDNLGDRVTGLGYKLGNKLLPPLTDVMEMMDENIDITDDVTNKMKSYNMLVDAGVIAEEKKHEIDKKLAEAGRNMIERQKILTSAIADTTTEIKLLEGPENRLIDAHNQAWDATTQLSDATDDLAASQEAIKQSMNDLQSIINGRLGPEMEKFADTQDELKKKMGEVKGKIDELNDQELLTTEQQDELDTLNQEYDDLKTQYDENATEHEEATKRILFDIITQQAAMDGLEAGEVEMLTTLATNWGLVDDKTAEAMQQASDAFLYYAQSGDAKGALAMLENMAGSIGNIEGYHKTTLEIEVTGDPIPSIPQYKPGQPYIGAAAGFEGMVRKPTLFLAGESGDEYVNIIPKSERMELKMVNIFGGAEMAMADHRNQLQPAAEPLTINLYAVPEKEKDMRRQARYIADEFERRRS